MTQAQTLAIHLLSCGVTNVQTGLLFFGDRLPGIVAAKYHQEDGEHEPYTRIAARFVAQ